MGAIADLPVVAYRLSVAGEDPDYLESVGYDIYGNEQWAVRSNGMCLSRSLEWDRAVGGAQQRHVPFPLPGVGPRTDAEQQPAHGGMVPSAPLHLA